MITRSTVRTVSPASLRLFSIISKSISQQSVCTKTESTPQSQYQICTNTHTNTNTNTKYKIHNIQYQIQSFNSVWTKTESTPSNRNRTTCPEISCNGMEGDQTAGFNMVPPSKTMRNLLVPSSMPSKVPSKMLKPPKNKLVWS